ncbi:MAG: glycosyltransferase family 2 protein [Bdellovibrionales bacterium]|nr:glycosyltransferase family 2 protein [Bdellovibrionales bacterium]
MSYAHAPTHGESSGPLSSTSKNTLDQPLISVVSPVYRAEKIVGELISRITQSVAQLTDSFEIVLVEDGSPDNSWGEIEKHAKENPHVRAVRLSRNFGQHNAVRAGVELARGSYVVIMDCDLQDDPEYIQELFAAIQSGVDIVFTRKKERKHSRKKNLVSYLFHWVFNLLTDTHQIDPNLSGYAMMTRKAALAFRRFREPNKAYISILQWIGLPHTTIEVEHRERFEGTSSYTFRTLLHHGITGLTANSDKLLWVSIYLGFFFFFFSLVMTGFIVGLYFTVGAQPGWTSIIAAMLLCTGLILVCLGIVGLYIGKIFELTKDRPLFLVDRIVTCEGEEKEDLI